jgi:hypothetical protein
MWLFNLSARSAFRLHVILTILWMLAIPIAIFTGLIYSLAFISAISLYANLAGHWAGAQAAKADIRSPDVEDEEQE